MAGFITSKTVDRAMIAADPMAAGVGFLSTILAVFGVFESLGLTADQVTILGGAVLGLAATMRVFYERGRREAIQLLALAQETLTKGKASSTVTEDAIEAPGSSEVP